MILRPVPPLHSTRQALPLALAALLTPVLAVASVQALVTVLALAALWSMAQQVCARYAPMPLKPALAVAAVTLFAALSGLWSPDPRASALTALRLGLLALAGLHLIGAAITLDAGQRRMVAIWAGAGLALAAVAAIAEYLGPHVVGRLALKHAEGAGKSVVNRVLSVLAMSSGPVAYALVAARRRWMAVGLVALLVVAVGAGDNSTAKAAMILGTLVFVAGWLLGRRLAMVLRVLLLAAVIGLPVLTSFLPDPARSYEAWGWQHSSLHHRLTIWRFVGGHIGEHPLVGWGMDSARTLPGGEDEISVARADGSLPVREQLLPLHPHNAVLQVWLELGAVGAAILGGVLWLAAGAAASLPDRGGRATAFATLAAAIVIATSSYGLWQGWWQAALWLTAMLATACLRRPGV